MAIMVSLLIAVGMSVLGMFLSSHQSETLRKQMNEFGQALAIQLATSSTELLLSRDNLGLKLLATNFQHNSNVLGVTIYDADTNLITNSGIEPHENLLDLYQFSTRVTDDIYSIDWQATINEKHTNLASFITPIKFRGLVTGHALITFNHYSMYSASITATEVIGAATMLLILATALATFSLTRSLTRPLQELMSATEHIRQGNYDPFEFKERRNDELGILMDAFNNMSEGLLQKNQVEHVFSQFVSANVAKQMLENLNEVELGGKRVEATVIFADIVGFTKTSEHMDPEDVAELLNFYFSKISKACSIYRGTIDKYMGDCAMIVYGVPEEDQEHRFHAIASAVLIHKMIQEINKSREEQGKTTVTFRIGINAGVMLAGNLGAEERMQYTVVGDSVNLASRLASVAGSGEIVIANTLFSHPDTRGRIVATQHEAIRLRGITDPVDTYIVQDIAATYKEIMKTHLAELIDGAELSEAPQLIEVEREQEQVIEYKQQNAS